MAQAVESKRMPGATRIDSSPPMGRNELDVEICWSPFGTNFQQDWKVLFERLASPNGYCQSSWLRSICGGLGHRSVVVATRRRGELTGVLPLAFMQHPLFGRHLVSLPFVNSAGVVAADSESESRLIEGAVNLADELRVRHLQLRHEREIAHPRLRDRLTSKVHMRLAMPSTEEELWKVIGSKTRNLVRKSQSQGLTVHWGGHDLLDEFYRVFARNMRDLGTPVFPRRLFAEILNLGDAVAELCVLRAGQLTVAGALLIHHRGVTEVPSASCLREFNHTNANMLMYWQLLLRTLERRHHVFDFGRSTVDSNTYRFKAQWGAKPSPAIWQYYVRRGAIGDTRPDSGKFGLVIRVWSRLPVWLTRAIGPAIVRGIP